MATNLRLSPATAAALREAAARTGRPRQELLREAVATFLGVGPATADRERAVGSGMVRAPTPFVNVDPFLQLSNGVSSVDLLDRDEVR